MHVKWKRVRLLGRVEFNQVGRARDAVLVQSVRVAGKVRHKSVAHLGTVTRWDQGEMSPALERRARSVYEARDVKPGEVVFTRRRGRSEYRADIMAGIALDRLKPHDTADAFISEAAIRIYRHAPAKEHERLVAKVEAFVSTFARREVKAPSAEELRASDARADRIRRLLGS